MHKKKLTNSSQFSLLSHQERTGVKPAFPLDKFKCGINKWGLVLALLGAALAFWPKPDAAFVLDDDYTVALNPRIKDVRQWKEIWTHRLFDAHPSAGYIKRLYYRPVLEMSFAFDYFFFKLNVVAYKIVNLLIHLANGLLVFWLAFLVLNNKTRAVMASAIFLILPMHEWAVRFVTGRGDVLQAFFGLLFLISFLHRKYVPAVVFFVLSLLTRESALLLPFFAYVLYKERNENRLIGAWLILGLIPLVVSFDMISKLGPIQAMHFFYFASIGACFWISRFHVAIIAAMWVVFFWICSWQGRFWGSEEELLRHTRRLEGWDYTVVHQQILMRYEDNLPAVDHLIDTSTDVILKSMWVRRKGVIYLNQGDLPRARELFKESLQLHKHNTDAQQALEVVDHALQR